MSLSRLEQERRKSRLSVSSLNAVLHGGADAFEQYQRWERLFSSNKLFDRTDDMFLSRPEYIKLAIERSFETYRIVKTNKDLLAAHSPLHGGGGFHIGEFGVASGLTDHFALFVGTLLMQGTREQQQEWLMKAINLQIIGTYAQTELGHGTNVRGLETTATYDVNTDEFILHSPTVSSTKWWPGALGLLATHAVLYARLLIHDKDYGFHAFVVQIRDENHCPVKGVECGDIGPKLGYIAYDSGYLRLTNVRVPRFNMLAKFQHVDKGGTYFKSSSDKALQKISYFTMLKTRVAISAGAGRALARAVTIATRYNAARLQGFIDSKAGGPEKPIIDHRVQATRLLQVVSTAYAMILSAREVSSFLGEVEKGLKLFGTAAAAVDRSPAKILVERSIALLPELHAVSCGLKAFTTDMSLIAMDEARKLCGGHGFALHAGFGLYYFTYLPALTYEGDFAPMALQCGRFLFKVFVDGLQRKPNSHLLGSSVRYLRCSTRRTHLKLLTSLRGINDFLNIDNMIELFTCSAKCAVARASYRLIRIMQTEKKSFAEAWQASQVDFFAAAKCHTLRYLLFEMVAAVNKTHDVATRSVLMDLALTFALSQIVSNTFTAPAIGNTDHKLSPTQVSIAASGLEQLVTTLRPELVTLVDGFGFSDFSLNTTIGNYENSDMYEKIVGSTAKNPLNTKEYVKTFHEKVVSTFLNKEYLRTGAVNQTALSKL